MEINSIPPELEMFSRIVDGQPPNVRELFQYALNMLMVEDGEAEIVEQRMIDTREYLTLQTIAGDSFTIAKPFVTEELLAEMRTMAREVLNEDRGSADGAAG